MDGDTGTTAKASHPTVEELVDYSIQASHARATDHILIAGRKTLGILFGVCHRGFFHANCRIAANRPHAGERSADSLWILNTQNMAELRTLIAECGRDLRPDGTLVVGLNPQISMDGAARLKDVLVKCGFCPGDEFHPAANVFLLCARKQNARIALAA